MYCSILISLRIPYRTLIGPFSSIACNRQLARQYLYLFMIQSGKSAANANPMQLRHQPCRGGSVHSERIPFPRSMSVWLCWNRSSIPLFPLHASTRYNSSSSFVTKSHEWGLWCTFWQFSSATARKLSMPLTGSGRPMGQEVPDYHECQCQCRC